MKIAEVSKKYGVSQDTLRYYERVGVIPPVNRAKGGSRDYTDEDCNWVELATCMRGAGLPVEVIVEYIRLFKQGDETIPDRLKLLTEQRDKLLEQKQAVDEMLERLNFKISRYERAVKTGVLSWEPDEELQE
ncbi:MerR family transcriptional regulator [Candidatus Methanomassiliicoccus intestinalis]|jgi:transcriptional regulator, merR family|uniref:Transcriptional regulator, MerR family protein n=2 Tax=Candidatus Methanomassiliicoccus intestinalis TaxID=1406512 RepID=R9T8S6_METII|nr:MerR family transcriptional regulator [Candidatus Methanomassiliicoccus intestinalis]AGN25763.1 transcriptional regulator, MerR family protein [Candidatus Methanomassiliicoccus intestinalis Issoire-Mx1]TQS82729.1 MAG: transcriptional regulator [Candidatus Methanomassiliicoccus intestinalis]TQS84113.1 MAG: transcriptional regulator [Candidatus Methanomassiliicoccus intestinalis]